MWLEGVGVGAEGQVHVGLTRVQCRDCAPGSHREMPAGARGAGGHCHPISQIKTLKLLEGSRSASTMFSRAGLVAHLHAFAHVGPSALKMVSWTVCLAHTSGLSHGCPSPGSLP